MKNKFKDLKWLDAVYINEKTQEALEKAAEVTPPVGYDRVHEDRTNNICDEAYIKRCLATKNFSKECTIFLGNRNCHYLLFDGYVWKRDKHYEARKSSAYVNA